MKVKSSYENVQIYTGIDVHKNSWELKSISDHVSLKQVHMRQPSAKKVEQYLRKTFPGADHICVYEAGFSGYWLAEQLKDLGVKTLIVHPGDVPTTDKEKRTKTDKIDCNKLAMSLRSGQLQGIFQPDKDQQQARSIVRLRYRFAVDERRMKNRIKAHLAFYGIELSELETNAYWSKRYINQLTNKAKELNDQTLELMLEKLGSERKYVLQSTRQLRQLSRSAKYAESMALLRSIPGVGELTAMVFLTELGTDLSRFKNDDRYISYIGLVPNISASGEKAYYGKLTRRGNKRLRTALILSSWMAIRRSGVFLAKYQAYRSEGKAANKAIVKIARKIALVMKAILRDKMLYLERN